MPSKFRKNGVLVNFYDILGQFSDIFESEKIHLVLKSHLGSLPIRKNLAQIERHPKKYFYSFNRPKSGCLDIFELSGLSDNPWICRLSVKNERFHGFGQDL